MGAAHLSRDEAAEVGVDVFHEGHVEQREARLHGSQDVGVSGQRMIPPLGFSPADRIYSEQLIYMQTRGSRLNSIQKSDMTHELLKCSHFKKEA